MGKKGKASRPSKASSGAATAAAAAAALKADSSLHGETLKMIQELGISGAAAVGDGAEPAAGASTAK
ncbi:unnamed protein product, partial [Ectocarpus sp. 12 AP-2014]